MGLDLLQSNFTGICRNELFSINTGPNLLSVRVHCSGMKDTGVTLGLLACPFSDLTVCVCVLLRHEGH